MRQGRIGRRAMAKDVDGGRERWSRRKDGWMEAEERKDEEETAVDKLKRQIKKRRCLQM